VGGHSKERRKKEERKEKKEDGRQKFVRIPTSHVPLLLLSCPTPLPLPLIAFFFVSKSLCVGASGVTRRQTALWRLRDVYGKAKHLALMRQVSSHLLAVGGVSWALAWG